jgi:hypothetical protein
MKHLNFLLLTIISLILLVSITSAQVSHPASEITAGTFGAGDFTFNGLLNIDTTNSYSAIDFYDNGVNKWGIGKNPSNNFYIDLTGVGNALTIDTNRDVSIVGRLKMNNEIQLARVSSLGACDGTNLGAMVFKTTDDEPYVCASGGWVSMSGSGAPGDTDGDGYPDATDCSPNDDPSDSSTWKYQLLPCYLDGDNDGDRLSFTTNICSGGSCAGSTGSPGSDCDDNNPTRFTGQTDWFTSSIDYNCDGSVSYEYTGIMSCGVAGWVGAVPGCGSMGNYHSGGSYLDCDDYGCACYNAGAPLTTQRCH